MGNNIYIKISWPESQSIMDWKDDYRSQCESIDEMAYMVPLDLWLDFKRDPSKFLGTDDLPW